MSKISYATYVKDRINGFSGERRAPADLDAFPEYKDKIAKSGEHQLIPDPVVLENSLLKIMMIF